MPKNHGAARNAIAMEWGGAACSVAAGAGPCLLNENEWAPTTAPMDSSSDKRDYPASIQSFQTV